MIPRRLAQGLALSFVVFGVVACGGDDVGAGEEGTAGAELGHVHGLGINPADDSLFIATHSGLFRAEPGAETAERVGDSLQDTMGFTVVGPDTFLGSGHPGPGEDGPPLLGLIRSTDAGQSWKTVSLAGEVDFHALEADHGRVYGFDSASGRLMTSGDGGETWEERQPPRGVLDIAVHPSDPERLAAASESGVQLSEDGGESWRPVGGEIGFIAWPAEDRLYLVGASGAVQVSSDLGRSWDERGSIGGQPAALIATSEKELYAALPDGTIQQSTDGGTTWTVRATAASG